MSQTPARVLLLLVFAATALVWAQGPTTLAAASPPAPPPAGRAEDGSVTARLAAIESRLDRIAAALEEQLELARLELIACRVESGERRLDALEGTRAQARSYLLSLGERRATADRILAGARERVETGWPPGPRSETTRLRDEAQTTLDLLDAEIAEQETAVAGLDARAESLRLEIAAWNGLLEAELGPRLPAAEEATEPPEPAPVATPAP
jgi:hypothetical protein